MRYAFCRGVVPPGPEDSNVSMKRLIRLVESFWRRPGRQYRLHEPPSANVVRVAHLTTEFRRRAAALILKTERLFYGRN